LPFLAVWGFAFSERIGAPSEMQYPEMKTNHLEKRRGVTFTNKLRARKEKKVQATRGLGRQIPIPTIHGKKSFVFTR
jgi:hypothetical protein